MSPNQLKILLVLSKGKRGKQSQLVTKGVRFFVMFPFHVDLLTPPELSSDAILPTD